jgi:predicted outer membrane repeat protein
MNVTNVVFVSNVADCSGGGIFNEGRITIRNSSFINNDGGPEGEGGGFFNNYGGIATVINSTFTGNNGRINGGGIHNHADLLVTGSVFSGNTAGAECPQCSPPVIGSGGAISNFPGTVTIENSTISTNWGGGVVSSGTATLTNSTVVFNSPDLFGGIANAAGATFNIRNSIIGGNGTGSSGATDLYGRFNSQGYNIVGTLGAPGTGFIDGSSTGNIVNVPMSSVNLGGLQNNGGPTVTHALLPGSIAINAGNPGFAPPPTTDQRGLPRVRNLRLDIGAFESDIPPANTNLIFDGGFTAGLASWGVVGDVFAQVVNGVFEVARNQGSTQPLTGFYQFSPYSAPANATFELTFSIGNRGQNFRTLNLVIGDANWQDTRNCFLTVPAGAPLRPYTMRFRTLQSWPNIVIRGFVLQATGDPAILLDNLNLQYRPGLSFGGNVQCPTIQ